MHAQTYTPTHRPTPTHWIRLGFFYEKGWVLRVQNWGGFVRLTWNFIFRFCHWTDRLGSVVGRWVSICAMALPSRLNVKVGGSKPERGTKKIPFHQWLSKEMTGELLYIVYITWKVCSLDVRMLRNFPEKNARKGCYCSKGILQINPLPIALMLYI